MLQHYEVGGISNVIHDVTTVICVTTQDNSVTYHHVHSKPGTRTVRLGEGTKNSLGARKNSYGRVLFENSIDRHFIKNNNYSTVRLIEACLLDFFCCFIEERLW